MITEWFMGLAVIVTDWVASLFPDWTPPDFLTQLEPQLADLFAQLNGIGAWADWAYIFGVVGAVVAVWVIAFIVKIARAVASYIPFFGGAG